MHKYCASCQRRLANKIALNFLNLCAYKALFGHFFVPFVHFWSFLLIKTELLWFLSVKSVKIRVICEICV